jgi:putative salt-induced outer membrane protein
LIKNFILKKENKMKNLLSLILILTSFTAQAENKSFSGSTEAGIIIISGNSDNESYNAKTENTYTVSEFDLMKVFGKYTRIISAGTESAKAWDAGLRYERIFTKDQFSAFLQQKAEHDPYNGIFIQRDSTDIGAKYTILSNDKLDWFAELGYQYSSTYVASEIEKATGSYIRGYTQGTYKFSNTAATKIWLEHMAPLKSSDFSRTNAELSVTATLTDILSLKMAYLINHNEAAVSPFKKDSTSYTTSLIAKY